MHNAHPPPLSACPDKVWKMRQNLTKNLKTQLNKIGGAHLQSICVKESKEIFFEIYSVI